jgi:hypothetical protein
MRRPCRPHGTSPRSADLVREHGRGHRAGAAGVEVGQQRCRFLAVERPFDMVAGRLDQRRQLVGGKGVSILK